MRAERARASQTLPYLYTIYYIKYYYYILLRYYSTTTTLPYHGSHLCFGLVKFVQMWSLVGESHASVCVRVLTPP